MGIFFDQDWFDARLKSAGLTRAALAQSTGMTIDEVEMVFADRRELEAPEVHATARLLAVDAHEIATRSGVSDPGNLASPPPMRAPRSGNAAGEFAVTREVIAGIHERIDRLERMLEMVLSKLDRR